ncbi:ABC transporter permease [Streptomyces formicae]|uniref:ABC transporter permease n=1 Tax=Streptomyces formicae TaxID=1616117 RepID=A0ABY3WP22_9ACTN|nr:ABC transporter permease [Streptomyces formicae]UNM12261.1 ABC transporter permease [Streptomyces formicae]
MGSRAPRVEVGHEAPVVQRSFRARNVGVPVFVLMAAGADLLWLRGASLDSIERRTLNADFLLSRTGEHLRLVGLAAVLVILIAIPLGVALSRVRWRWPSAVVFGAANAGQAAPVIGILVLLTMVYGPGFGIAVVSLVAYCVLPVLRNTAVGVRQVDPAVVEAARGMGMKPLEALWKVELPLAVPVVLSGLRISLVLCVGAATLATFVNAGGLGDIIVNGIKLDRTPVLVTGSLLTASIALLADWIAGLAESAVKPRGA